MGGVILASEGVGCNFWPREGCKNEGSSHGDPPSPPPLCPPVSVCMGQTFPIDIFSAGSVKLSVSQNISVLIFHKHKKGNSFH